MGRRDCGRAAGLVRLPCSALELAIWASRSARQRYVNLSSISRSNVVSGGAPTTTAVATMTTATGESSRSLSAAPSGWPHGTQSWADPRAHRRDRWAHCRRSHQQCCLSQRGTMWSSAHAKRQLMAAMPVGLAVAGRSPTTTNRHLSNFQICRTCMREW